MEFPWHLDQQDMWHFLASKMCSEGTGEMFASLLLYKKSGEKISPWHACGAESTLMMTLLYSSVAGERMRERHFLTVGSLWHCVCAPGLRSPKWRFKTHPSMSLPLMDVFVNVYLFIYFLYFYIAVCSSMYIKLSSFFHWLCLSIITISSFFPLVSSLFLS